MRRIRNALVLAAFIVGLGSLTSPVQASRCNQYPYFIQPLVCRVFEG